MLQSIRDRSQGLIVGIIVFLISMTFALWGIQEYIQAGARVIVAEVEGEEIELREFQNAFQQLRRQAQSLLGESFDSVDWASDIVKQRALDELVSSHLLAQLADDSRIRITDAQVTRRIQKLPAFQDEVGFSRSLYEQRVSLYGFSEQGFEQEVRRDLATAQLRAGMASSAFVTIEEARWVERLRRQKRDIGYGVLPVSEFENDLQLDDAFLESYFEKHKERYRTLEDLSLEYLEISAAALEGEVPVSDEVLRINYGENEASYRVSEQRDVNHLLIRLAERAPTDEVKSAQDKAEEIRARVAAGETLQEIALELSKREDMEVEAGETGYFERGVMAPEFEQAAFALEIDEISGPVRTKFGYHLLELKDVKPGRLRSFNESLSDVEVAYRADESKKLFFEQAERFSNLVYEHPEDLDVAANALGLAIQTTEMLTRAQIASEFSEKVTVAAFESDVLVNGLNSEPIELEDGRVMAVRALKHRPAIIPLFQVVREQVRADARGERLRELAEEAGRGVIDELRNGGTVADLLGSRGFGWERIEAADRETSGVSRAILRAAFRADVPESGPIFTGVSVGEGDYAVIRVANVVTPSVDDIDSIDVDEVRQKMLSERSDTVWTEFLDSLEASSDVELFAENL